MCIIRAGSAAMSLLNRQGNYGSIVAVKAVDTSTNAPSILAINIVFCAITVIAVSLRIYVRTVILRVTGVDDWLLVIATVFTLRPMMGDKR